MLLWDTLGKSSICLLPLLHLLRTHAIQCIRISFGYATFFASYPNLLL